MPKKESSKTLKTASMREVVKVRTHETMNIIVGEAQSDGGIAVGIELSPTTTRKIKLSPNEAQTLARRLATVSGLAESAPLEPEAEEEPGSQEPSAEF